MNTLERRRSPRVLAFLEEAVLHSRGRDIPVTLIDISSSGALVGLVDSLALDTRKVSDDEQLQLSMHYDRSIFQIDARVIRAMPQFVAVEFSDNREGIQKTLKAKVELLAASRNRNGRAKAAAG
jgi:c-di-GMP-binding flagellar brake protein YcgR